jgi:hypothetical protein
MTVGEEKQIGTSQVARGDLVDFSERVLRRERDPERLVEQRDYRVSRSTPLRRARSGDDPQRRSGT